MASPQTENGYTKIANELLDALARIRLSGEETQVFMVILRKTYGFNKKTDVIALSQFTKLTGIKRQNVYRAIKKLVEKNIVIKKDYSRLVSYGIQKDYSKWKPLSKKITVINIDSSCNQKRFKKESKKITPSTKETFTKETLTKHTEAFEKFKQAYPKDRWERTEYCKMKFMALCKQGKIDQFRKACQSYANFMEYERTERNFNRTWMLSSTFMNNWKEWYEKDFKYKAPL